MTITTEGRLVLEQERPLPALHPRVEFCADDGTVCFVYELENVQVRPGDDVMVTWRYPRVEVGFDPAVPLNPEGPTWEHGPDGSPRVVHEDSPPTVQMRRAPDASQVDVTLTRVPRRASRLGSPIDDDYPY